MYRIIQPDGKVFLQMELTDYFDPQLKQTFLYKTWLKKGFIAAIRGYYLQSASTHKEHRQQDLAAFRQTLLDPLLIPSIPTSTIINCNIFIDLRLLPMPIQVASKSAVQQQIQITVYLSIGSVYLEDQPY